MEAPGLSYQYLGFNLDDPVLSDVRVRRAIALAIDVDALIRYRQQGHSTRAAGLLLPDNPYALPAAAPPKHDPAQAAKLLDAAGFPLTNGNRFALTYKTSTDRAAVIQARAIQSDLRQVGVEVAVRAYEWGTFYEDVQKGNFQLFSLRWVGVSDPDFYYELFHSSRVPPDGRNRVRYRNLEVDQLLEEGRVTSDATRRRETYFAVQRALLRDLPYLSLWHNHNVAVVSRDIEGFRLHPTGGFQHLVEVHRIGR
jgi:peptide/nickel transport system substrate-binding protein